MGVVHGANCETHIEGEESDNTHSRFYIENLEPEEGCAKFYMDKQEPGEVGSMMYDCRDPDAPSSKFCTDTSEHDEEGSRYFVYYITCCAAMGGLLFGYDTGVISGSMLFIEVKFQLSTIWKESIVSATVGAAAVFALIAGNLTDYIGRKKVVMLGSVLFMAGSVVMATAPGKEVLLVGRMVSGTGLGKSAMNNTNYITCRCTVQHS